MKTTRINANSHGPQADHVAVTCKPIDIAGSRRARLMGASAIAGGALRGFAIAAGMVTVFGTSPVLAQCQSTDTNFSGTCAATASGPASTAVGELANAAGGLATAYGNSANAIGDNATATGASSIANGSSATATGVGAVANGGSATATGQLSNATGVFATATGEASTANGANATAT